MAEIKITKPANDGDNMPDPIEGTFVLSSVEFQSLSLTDDVFIHLVITGKGPRGQYQTISGNAEIVDKETWKFDLAVNNVRLKPDFTYDITAQLILSSIVEDHKFDIQYSKTERVIVPPKNPKKRKKS
jgi:hypothetical protein